MTERKNPFDLNQPRAQKNSIVEPLPVIGGARAKPAAPSTKSTVTANAPIVVKSKNLTYEEIMKLLEGYVLLPKEYWYDLRLYKKHIRYVKVVEDMFVRGGFIVGFVESQGKKAYTITTDPSGGPKAYTWVAALSSIQSIFVKRETIAVLKKDADQGV